MMDYVMALVAVLGIGMMGLSITAEYQESKQPELFDSLLCSKHTPVAAILVTDELIMCNQVMYRRVK